MPQIIFRLKNWKDKIVEKIILQETIVKDCTIEELKEKIENRDKNGFEFKWLNTDKFYFSSIWSIGTMDDVPSRLENIQGYGKLKINENGKLVIELFTKVRVEMYFITIVFVIFYIAIFLSEEEVPIWCHLIYPIILLWFWGVFRIQERILFNKMKTFLKDNGELKVK